MFTKINHDAHGKQLIILAGVTIGKKKRTKLRNLLRSVAIGGPSTSISAVASAIEIHDVEDDDDLMPSVIDMVTGELEIVLDEHALVYNQNNLSYDPFLIASKTYWHQIEVSCCCYRLF